MTQSDTSTILGDEAVPPVPARNPLREFEQSDLYAAIQRRIERSPWLWPYGGLAFFLFLVTFGAWFSTGRIVLSGDAVLIHYPWFEFWRDEIFDGRIPFWNPYTFSGFPAFATPQSGFAYPPHWALTWMPSVLAMNWLIGLHIMLAGLSTAWCAGKLGANKDGQFLAGACFALGSALTARMVAGHLSFFEAIAWLPLATGLAVSITEQHRPWQLALVLGMMTLAGQPEVTIFAGWWLPLWAAGIHIFRGRREAAIAVGRTAMGLVLGLGLAAFFLLPLIELQNVSNRSVGFDWDFRTGGSLPLWHLLGVINPRMFGNPENGTYWPGPGYEWHERLLYIGFLPLVIAFFARGRVAWVCWGAAAVALALAFGRYVPWYTLTTSVPGYEYLRIPGRHVELAALALALAAGVGLQRLSGRTLSIVAVGVAALLFIGSVSASLWLPAFVGLLGGTDGPAKGMDLGPLADRASTPLVVGAVLLALLALLAQLPGTWFRRAVLVIAVLEVALVLGPHRFQSSNPEDIYRDARGYLPADSRRAIVNDGALLANYGPVLKAVQPGGYTSLFSLEYMELLTGQRNPGVVLEAPAQSGPILYLLGYDSAVERKTALVSVFEPKPPAAWVARCSWPGAAAEARQPGFPLFNCVTRKDAQTREAEQPAGVASLVGQHAGRLELSAEGPGHLVTTTPIYPGWSAKIDGKSAPVEALDGALLGVELPEGAHTVVFSYRPAGLTFGLLLTALSAAALAGIWWWERRTAATVASPRY